MALALLAAALAALLAAAPAEARQRRDRIAVPVPNAGDVTLVRVLLTHTRTSRRTGRGPLFSVVDRQTSSGMQIAAVGSTRFFGPRAASDVLIAVARQAIDQGNLPSPTVTLRIRWRGVRTRRVRQIGESNARFFFEDDRRCGDLAAPLAPSGDPFTQVVDRGPWRMSARAFVQSAHAWGCGDPSEPPGDGPFEPLMYGALGTGYVTWVLRPDSEIVRVCVFIYDAPGVPFEVSINDARAPFNGAGVVGPRRVSYAYADFPDGEFGVGVRLRRAGSDGTVREWRTVAVSLPFGAGPPPPPEPPFVTRENGRRCAD